MYAITPTAVADRTDLLIAPNKDGVFAGMCEQTLNSPKKSTREKCACKTEFISNVPRKAPFVFSGAENQRFSETGAI
jgi:hypothetical protein